MKLQVRDQPVQNVTFRLLAIEQDFDYVAMRSAQYLIKHLLLFGNWQNGTIAAGFQYFSYIHLLSNVNYDDIDPDCQPYYKGNVTKANVIDEISNFLSQTLPRENPARSVRILYYIGRSNKAITRNNTSFYMALDHPIYDSELNQTLLKGALHNSNSTLIILDTNYSGGYIAKLARPGRLVLTACNPIETAKGVPGYWGWFTGHKKASYENGTDFGPLGILGAIEKAKDVNGDGWKSASEIFPFASRTTTWYAANQTDPATQKRYSQHPWASYGVTGGQIPIVQCNISKPFPYNGKAWTPPPISPMTTRYSPKQFEHRMYRHSPNHTGHSSAPGPRTPSLLWTKPLVDPITSSIAVADGMVFVGTQGGMFYALEMKTGEIVWSFSAGSPIFSSPAIMDGMAFFATLKPGKIIALDEYTGLIRWAYDIPTEAPVYSSPVVVDRMVFIGSSDRYIRALSQFEGTLLWDCYIGGEVRSSPAVADGMVFVGSDRGIYALDEMTGTEMWHYPTQWRVSSSPAIANGMVFIGSENDDKIYALKEMKGTLVWSYPTGGWLSSPAVDSDKNLVIVGCKDSRVYCLDTRTGFLKWIYITGPIEGSSPALSSNGYVYIGSTNKNVYCLNETNGIKIWSYTTGNQITSSPTIIYEHVLIGSQDGKVYCFGPPFPVHNLAVLNVTVSATALKPGDSVHINYTVRNKGNVPETFNVTCAYNTSDVWTAPEYSSPTVIHIETITLAPETNLTKTYAWNTTDTHPGAHSMLVQAHLVPDEIDASDNTYIDGTVMLIMPPDLDANGEVNILDIAIVAKAFGSRPVDDGWNPNADLDGNGKITIKDIAIVAKEFGKIYF